MPKISKKQLAVLAVLASLGVSPVVIDQIKSEEDPQVRQETIDEKSLLKAQARYARWKVTGDPADIPEASQWQLLLEAWNKEIDRRGVGGRIRLRGIQKADEILHKTFLKVDDWNK